MPGTLLVASVAAGLIFAACGGDNRAGTSSTTAGAATSGPVDISGRTVTMLGTETAAEADALSGAFRHWEMDTGASLSYRGSLDAESQLRSALATGGPLPDIFLAPYPGLVKDFAPKARPMPNDLIARMNDDMDPDLVKLGSVDGVIFGMPLKLNLTGLVWYSPKVFDAHDYHVPQTWDALVALTARMKADGIPPWCTGIEFGDATGWPMTNWMENIMLRLHGPEIYDKWVSHAIPFNDPQVRDVAAVLGDMWFADGNVLNGRPSIASTGAFDAGLPVLNGKCGMFVMGEFYENNFLQVAPKASFGPDGDVSAFSLPAMTSAYGNAQIVSGIYAMAFDDRPETVSALHHLESAAYAEARVKAQKHPYLAANKKVDVAAYDDELDRQIATLFVQAGPVRYDGSDSMPPEVGYGSFWVEGTKWVNGTEDLDAFLDNVEASWPHQ
jgi:alpha-glucoside transport system substrate-binding protein